jgi:rubrerythrin
MAGARVREVIDFAIRKEQEAIDLYNSMSETVRAPQLREMLSDLAKQEVGHRRMLEELTPAKLGRWGSDEIPDLGIAESTEGAAVAPDADYQDILAVAMKREEKARDLYTLLASNTEEGDLRELFEFLAREEQKHKLALEKEYDEHVLTDN